MKKKIGKIFWLTGLSGSGKTTIGKLIHKDITKLFGPTILINGDDIRNIFNIVSYDKKSRLKIGKQYSDFCKFVSYQNINIIITVVGLFYDLHSYNRKNNKNYIEIYIKSNFKEIKKQKKKFFYKKKTKNVWGEDLKPEFPINPHIVVKNNFKTKTNILSKKIIKKIKQIYK